MCGMVNDYLNCKICKKHTTYIQFPTDEIEVCANCLVSVVKNAEGRLTELKQEIQDLREQVEALKQASINGQLDLEPWEKN